MQSYIVDNYMNGKVEMSERLSHTAKNSSIKDNDIEARFERLAGEILKDLYHNGLILTWFRDKKDGYTLASGKWSPFYINLRSLLAYPHILKKIALALSFLIDYKIITDREHTTLIGLPMSAIPIATAISLHSNIPSAFFRQKLKPNSNNEEERKIYGVSSLIEGRFCDGDNVILVDDVVSLFTSKEIYINALHKEAKKQNIDIALKHVLVLIDREQGGSLQAKKYKVSLISLIPFKSKGLSLLKDSLSNIEYKVIKDYLNDEYEVFQDRKFQRDIIRKSKSSL